MEALYSLANHHGTLLVTLVIWIGVFLYLLRLDRQMAELEDEVSEKRDE